MACGFPYCGGNDCAACHKPAPFMGKAQAQQVDEQGQFVTDNAGVSEGCAHGMRWDRTCSACSTPRRYACPYCDQREGFAHGEFCRSAGTMVKRTAGVGGCQTEQENRDA
jgi:hypothetical protein